MNDYTQTWCGIPPSSAYILGSAPASKSVYRVKSTISPVLVTMESRILPVLVTMELNKQNSHYYYQYKYHNYHQY